MTRFLLPLIFCFAGAASPSWARSVVVISVDGMRPDYVTQAEQHGLKIPNLKQFLLEGTYADGVIPDVPSVTYPDHITLITGVTPAEHGILTNQLFDPMHTNPVKVYLYASEIRVPTLWQAAASSGIVVASVGWPASVGAKGVTYLIPEYDGRVGSGQPTLEDLSQPPGWLARENQSLGAVQRSHQDLLAADRMRTRYAVDILRTAKPGFMTIHLGAVDEAEHATGPFSQESDQALEGIDAMVGEIESAALANDPSAAIVVVSDHGFARTDYKVNLELIFAHAGLIRLKDGPNGPAVASWDAEFWRATGCAAVMLRDPSDRATYEKVKTLLATLRADPKYGINRVLEQPEIRRMGAFPDAAFLIEMKLDYEPGYDLTGADVVPVPATGTHGYLPDHPEMRASFFAKGKGIAAGRDLGVIDIRRIAPTLAAQLKIAFPSAKEAPLPLAP